MARTRMPSKREFVAWLKSQPEGAGVGFPGKGTDCPIARCAKDKGVVGPIVYGDEWGTWPPDQEAELRATPGWVDAFVDAVDVLPASVRVDGEASREACLLFLGVDP